VLSTTIGLLLSSSFSLILSRTIQPSILGMFRRDAQLLRIKTLEEFDFGQAPQIPAAKIRELAEGGYIDRSEPVVLIGECGTGKSHLATGLCLAACRQKRRVRFTTAAALVNELVEAKQNGQVRRLMARWQKYELIAVDEVGYVPLADVGAEFLFQVISDRAEKAALIVTTNRLCGSPHKRFNAESSFMLRTGIHRPICDQVEGFSLRITGVVFSIAIN
jgi:DNA replication protein DnaC